MSVGLVKFRSHALYSIFNVDWQCIRVWPVRLSVPSARDLALVISFSDVPIVHGTFDLGSHWHGTLYLSRTYTWRFVVFLVWDFVFADLEKCLQILVWSDIHIHIHMHIHVYIYIYIYIYIFFLFLPMISSLATQLECARPRASFAVRMSLLLRPLFWMRVGFSVLYNFLV